jgi:phospholipase C
MKPRFQALSPYLILLAGLMVVGILFPRGAHTAPALIAPPGLEKINHFVFIMQENRSFDSYFGTYPGVEGLPPGICLTDPTPGAPCVKPFHDTNNVNRGGPHGWDNAHADINNGLMDGFLIESYKGISKNGNGGCHPPQPMCTPGKDPRDVMGWHDSTEIPNYWSYANLYVLQDRLFESVAS